MTQDILEYYLLDNMLTLGVLTGSRAFNCAHEDSDWDIVVTDYMLPNYHSIPTLENLINWDSDWEGISEADGDLTTKQVYDKDTIWGPIYAIDRYSDAKGNNINLFIYEDAYKDILPLFIELNHQMNFLYPDEVHDKDKRIDRFIELTDKLGITNFKH